MIVFSISKLKKARFYAGLTQDRLSLLTGIDRARISRIENGYVTPTERERKIISRVLKMKPEELFD
ncbi:MAG: helix-turn-helix transcriptional regulator [Candidatus Helarchaeota archaeon]